MLYTLKKEILIMNKYKILLLIIGWISFIITIISLLFYVFSEIIGAGIAEDLLKKIHIPISYETVILIGLLSSVITFFAGRFYKKL